MSSVSFDPVSHKYDATRGYPEKVGRQLAQRIDQGAGGNTQSRFLEVGVGTGRIAVPLAELGRQYTGIDISEKMLSRMEEKLYAKHWREVPLAWGSVLDEDVARKLDVRRFVQEGKPGAMRLVVSDMTALPFHDQSFDAVIAVHVFHLVSDWQKALKEVLRVLRPGGVLMRCWDDNWEDLWKPGPNDIRGQWSKIVQELGGSTTYPGVGEQVVAAWLQQQGFETEQVGVVTWEREITARAIYEGVEQRLWTTTLLVPDDIFAASLERLRQWVEKQYGTSIDDVYVQQQRIVISRTQVPH
ncbi:MAG TPA: class I SAM-dependent methyltransferase [Ktedonosporobacter sp.]|nr:class I SAM-dependent methyltransferase [Ktedonosporobacter sp.]